MNYVVPSAFAADVFPQLVHQLVTPRIATHPDTSQTRAALAAERLAERVRVRAARGRPSEAIRPNVIDESQK